MSTDFTKNLDGGRYALAGFLYQLLVTAGLTARVSNLTPGGDTEIGCTFESISTASVSAETFGQDVLVEFENRDKSEVQRILIQCKFSMSPDDNQIQNHEMDKIALSFCASFKRAQEHMKSSTVFLLVTNRPVASSGKSKTRSRKSAVANASSRTISKLEVRARMLIHKVTPKALMDELHAFAGRHGVLKNELERAVHSIIGNLVLHASAPGTYPIDRSWFLTQLTGSHAISEITPSVLSKVMLDELEDKREMHRVPQTILPRTLCATITEAACQTPLVFVVGNGGCGKTVLLYEVVRNAITDSETRRYGFLKSAESCTDRLIQEQVTRWRLPAGSIVLDDINSALQRLEMARTTPQRPMLVVGIDGLDEALSQDSMCVFEIKKLFDLAWDEFRRSGATGMPRWTVVVTCRDDGNILDCWRSYESDTIKDFLRPIIINDFSANEMCNAAHSIEDGRLTKQLLEAYSTSFGDTMSADRRGRTVRGIGDTLKKSLSHPAMWGCFCSEQDDMKERILSSDPHGLGALAAKYVSTYIYKFGRRYRIMKSLNLSGLLKRVAVLSLRVPFPLTRNSHWIEPAVSTDEWDRSDAKRTWEEAVSFGMISLDSSDTWRWTHQFVATWLAESANT